jgi:DNA processing protein
MLAPGESGYPSGLTVLEPTLQPKVLHVLGELPDGPALAIVGTRQARPVDHQTTEELAAAAVGLGLWVLSGGALGVDAAAHRGALEAGGRTVALVGGGLSDPYPPQNRSLFLRMIESGSAVASLEAPEAPPTRASFPRRNKVVATWSRGTLVVAAPSRSGALITARDARQAGRPLAAVPGTAGTDELIAAGATPVSTPAELAAWAMAFVAVPVSFLDPAGEAAAAAAPAPALSIEDRQVLALLGEHPRAVDELGGSSGLRPSALLACLVSLELRGLCLSYPGPSYARPPGKMRTTP